MTTAKAYYVQTKDFSLVGPGVLQEWLSDRSAYPTVELATAAILLGMHKGIRLRIVDHTGAQVGRSFTTTELEGRIWSSYDVPLD